MKRTPRRLACTLAVVGGLVLSGCSSGGDVTSLGPVPSVPTTTVVEATTTTNMVAGTTSTTAGRGTGAAPGTTTTTRAQVTTTRPPTTTTSPPRSDNGLPQVTATPSSGPVGARIQLEGTGFTEENWKARGASLWLTGTSGCGVFAEAEHTVAVSAGGRLTGDFVVPATGGCRQSGTADMPVTPGTYEIVFACTPCSIGRFRVTG